MSSHAEPRSRTSDWGHLALFLAVAYVASAIGGAVTLPAIPDWYASLEKPWFTPPNWVFGVVWTILYNMMAVAAWLVWRAAGWRGGRRALALYHAQLALNVLWPVLFFGLKMVDLALVEVAVLAVAVAATIWAFRPISGVAALLLVPYLAWAAFATALNAGIAAAN